MQISNISFGGMSNNNNNNNNVSHLSLYAAKPSNNAKLHKTNPKHSSWFTCFHFACLRTKEEAIYSQHYDVDDDDEIWWIVLARLLGGWIPFRFGSERFEWGGSLFMRLMKIDSHFLCFSRQTSNCSPPARWLFWFGVCALSASLISLANTSRLAGIDWKICLPLFALRQR